MSASTSPSTGNGSDLPPPLPVEPIRLERQGLFVSLLATLLLLGIIIGFIVVAGCTTARDENGPVMSEDQSGTHPPGLLAFR